MPFFSYLNEDSSIRDIILRDMKFFSPLNRSVNIMLRGPSPFTIGERELIASYVSGLNECRFCYGTHAAVAESFGVETQLLESLLNNFEVAAVKEELKPVLRFARKLTLDSSKMVQADAQEVFDVGWSEEALYQVICIVALFNCFNRLLDGHGIKGHDAMFKPGAAYLVKFGYELPWFLRPFTKLIRKLILARDNRVLSQTKID